jgi:hypothetical protein
VSGIDALGAGRSRREIAEACVWWEKSLCSKEKGDFG